MSVLYERIERLCKDKGSSITDMCRESGASRGSLSDLKMGRISGLNAATLSKLAAYFDVSVDYLLGKEETKKPADTSELSAKKKLLMERVMSMSDSELEKFDQILRIVEGKQ